MLSRLGFRRRSVSSPPAPPVPPALAPVLASLREGRHDDAARQLARRAEVWRHRPRVWGQVARSAPLDAVVDTAFLVAARGQHELAAGILSRLDLDGQPADVRRRAGGVLLHGGRHPAAVHELGAVLEAPDAYDAADAGRFRESDLWRLGIARLYRDANQRLADVAPPPGPLRGLVLVYNVSHPVVSGLMVPLVGALAEEGHAVAAVTVGTLRRPDTGVDAFDALNWGVNPDGMTFRGERGRRLRHDWTVDWAEGVVETDGINYFDYFQERIAQSARRYRVDLGTDEASAKRFRRLLRRADVALAVCERLADVARDTGLPVRVAMMDSHFAPQGVIREWCDQRGRDAGVHAVVLSVGYENYYSNLGNREATTLAVEDLTAQPDLRQPFLGGSHRMHAVLGTEPALGREPDDELRSWICQDRSKVDETSAFRESVVQRARAVREAGGKVFVALGKVSIDFAAPGDRGVAHADFVDWANHLVDAVDGTANLLLVKPHPHELREEIVVEGVQLFRDLVRPDLPDNVVFLEHHSFNTHELSDLVDAAFLWNGTASLEFSVLGVPVVPASVWAVRDYPVGLEVLSTRPAYDEVLSGRRTLTVAPDAARLSATMLRLMRSDHVAMPYPYLRRPATNLSIGPPALNLEHLDELRSGGDRYVDRAASRFFEFHESR